MNDRDDFRLVNNGGQISSSSFTTCFSSGEIYWLVVSSFFF